MHGIQMRGITMRFGEKSALCGVDLTIKQGTIHAIVGENGAGKSTLMNILSGVLQPTEGTVTLDGKTISMRRPQDATAHAIGMVYQHFMLVPHLRVWQNIILGIEPVKGLGRIDKKAAIALIEKACRDYGMEVNPEQVTGKLTIGEQQRVEILKVMVRDANYIIFDEPTAVLTPQEIDLLLENIRTLREMGKTILFISHKLDEVLRIADEITVLRQGCKVGTVKTKEICAEDLVEMMVGRKVKIDGYPAVCNAGEAVLIIESLATPRSQFASGLCNVNLTVHAGEVLGVAGVDGNGQTELVNAILGFEPILGGSIEKNQVDVTRMSAAAIRSSGISLVPPDRQKQGLVMDSSVLKNTVLGVEQNPKFCRNMTIDSKKVKRTAEQLMKAYDVRLPSIEANASALSGGNQQKVILAREFGLRDSDLVIAVNPTRGLDIGAIEFVYAQVEEQKAAGKAILLVSTELSEIMRLSDRIAVFYKGECMDVISRADANPEKIGMLMMGLRAGGVQR